MNKKRLAITALAAGLTFTLAIRANDSQPSNVDAREAAIDPTTGRPAPEPDKDYEQWREAKGMATPVSKIRAPAGFVVELLRSALPHEGSWISMAFDSQGRLYIGIEGQWKREGQGILRMTLTGEAVNPVAVELVENSLVECRGLLWAHDSLYAQCNVSTKDRASGLYRLRDNDDDGRFDDVKLLRHVPGGGHGLNDLTLGPDGFLYLIQGDQSSLPADWQPEQTLVRNVAVDRVVDVYGYSHEYRMQRPMEGRLIRTDADGRLWQVIASGMRNPMGIDFNPDGELFTYEADMEWDVGLPWYRPTHLIHLLSGTDYGWRQGPDPWPLESPDLPPVGAVVGLGSPTAVKFGTRSHFPSKFREALFIQDWAYGRILAVHLTPQGAGYRTTWEPFLDGRPLNVTDMEFGPDGAMYFLTGGRGTQSGLYRVRYVGSEVEPASTTSSEEQRQRTDAVRARALRRQIEAFHGRTDPAAVQTAWPHLGSEDPWIRHAARIAVEHQPVVEWQSRALAETHIPTAITAWLALTRAADRSVQEALLGRLNAVDWAALTSDQQLHALRVYELCFHRMGLPAAETTASVLRKLNSVYPAQADAVNRQLCTLLLYLGADDLAGRTLRLVAEAATQEQKLHYLNALRAVREGWRTEELEAYFRALGQLRTVPGGRAYPGFVEVLIADSLAKLPADRRPWAQQIIEAARPAESQHQWSYTPRRFVKAWTMAELEPILRKSNDRRDYEAGKRLFAEVGCLQCHRMGNQGGVMGPDLTQVSSRFGRMDILRSIIEPSAVMDEKYRIVIITMNNGRQQAGYVLQEDDRVVTISADPWALVREKIEKAHITARQWSPVSSMPTGLLDTLTSEEVLDLLAYIDSGGSTTGEAFRHSQPNE